MYKRLEPCRRNWKWQMMLFVVCVRGTTNYKEKQKCCVTLVNRSTWIGSNWWFYPVQWLEPGWSSTDIWTWRNQFGGQKGHGSRQVSQCDPLAESRCCSWRRYRYGCGFRNRAEWSSWEWSCSWTITRISYSSCGYSSRRTQWVFDAPRLCHSSTIPELHHGDLRRDQWKCAYDRWGTLQPIQWSWFLIGINGRSSSQEFACNSGKVQWAQWTIAQYDERMFSQRDSLLTIVRAKCIGGGYWMMVLVWPCKLQLRRSRRSPKDLHQYSLLYFGVHGHCMKDDTHKTRDRNTQGLW